MLDGLPEPPLLSVLNDEPPPTTGEVSTTMRKMKNGKAPGVDEIPCEMIKAGGPVVVEVLTKLFISLLIIDCKVFTAIICNSMTETLQSYQVEEKVGALAGCSPIDQVFVLCQLGKKFIEHNKTLYHILVDFTMTFDSVWRQDLQRILYSIGVNAKLVRPLRE